ncbi:ras GTPase-activating protein 1 isoform X2 [Plutella xylostella]|uniref:ras GTPase-activating protein 1 isoform X2 n=1 Tax=Plutella xylostella TaxID=51655 RepID=UPI0020330D3D|nr:ras GTPase-activating protein 1 isoform X2 [Plutella xylostella]
MADLIRVMGAPIGPPVKDKLGSPSTESEDGGGDLAELAADLELDEADGPSTNGDRQAMLAPPETEWYHGRLDRYTSEERLWAASKLGSYLVRESDRKPGSYVLSYLGRTGINHFRITAVCGDYYIGGRQFDSLPELVSFYSHCSDLLKRERLLEPVAPPEPVNDKKRVVAILPYTKMPDTDELTFQKGDIFFVHNDMGDGWLWVTAHRTGEQGMIFRELVEDLDAAIDPNTVFPWFHPNCSKSEAVDMLVKAGPGSFLVRPSDNSPGDYSLFFHINNQIQRFRIEKKGVRYLMGGRTFECLDAVINRYRKEQIVEGHTLGQPLHAEGHQIEPQQNATGAAAEKIYATLRECRDQIGLKKMKGIKHQGYLNKKSDKTTKKWKALYFVLLQEGTDTHLYFYDSPKRTKPKGLIDLSCAYLYQVHESLWDREFCFQLVERALPCLSTHTHLAANSAADEKAWLEALRPLCVSQFTRQHGKTARVRWLRVLRVRCMTAHRLPARLAPRPALRLALGAAPVARTRAKPAPDPHWDELFVFDDVPPDVTSFTITVQNAGKRGKESEVAELTIELSTLANGEEVEEWYPLAGMTPIGEWGSLRLRIRFMHELVMPREEYSPLRQLLLEPGLPAVRALAELCRADRQPAATALLHAFTECGRGAELSRELLQAEVNRETDPRAMFRAASLATAVLDQFMHAHCKPFLQAAIAETVQKLIDAKQSAELNPTKMDSPEDACNNAEFLLMILDQITLSIFTSPEACPRPVRYRCACLQRAAVAKWPNERFARTRVVSGFIFLRLICPALVEPRAWALCSGAPPPHAQRSLLMVAKCLQNLANLIEFGAKEPYMEVVNPFILKNKERMVVFLDQLSAAPEPGASPPNANNNSFDIAKELATLHHICVAHLAELQTMAKTQPAIRKLVTVTEMLTKHKHKYLEMIR